MDVRTPRHGRTRAAKIARRLEQTLGVPRQARRLPPPLDMLIATVLSQNTSDRNSHRAFINLREKFPSWESLANARVEKIRRAIRIGGMANQKAPRIRDIIRAVHSLYGEYSLNGIRRKGSEAILEELTTLDGVGPKTAACVLLFSLGRDVFPVDTHIHRICNRLGLVRRTATPEKTFHAMRGLVPHGKAYSFHTNLIRFGRKICRATGPLCGECPVYDECAFPGKTGRRRVTRPPSRTDHDFMLLDNVG